MVSASSNRAEGPAAAACAGSGSVDEKCEISERLLTRKTGDHSITNGLNKGPELITSGSPLVTTRALVLTR